MNSEQESKMRKLDRGTIKQRDEIIAKLHESRERLQSSIDAFNEALEGDLRDAVESAVESYNEAVEDANQWSSEVASEIQSYIDDRSEKWQESDRAKSYELWRSSFEDHVESVSIEWPDQIDLDAFEMADELLEQMPEELPE